MLGSAIRGWTDIPDVEALVAELCRDLDAADRALPPAVAHSVLVATQAFVTADGHGQDAARRAGPTLMRLGRRAAVRGQTEVQLSTDLRRVVEDRARLADPVIARIGPAEDREAIRGGLREFLHQVHHAALTGHRQARTMMALGAGARRDMVSRALFASESVPEDLVALAGIDVAASYVPLVWVEGSTGARAAARLPHVLVDTAGVAALVPRSELDLLVLGPGERAVSGPARRLHQVGEALRLTRQAAAAVRTGLIDVAPVPITPCADIAAQLLVVGRTALAELLVEKYLVRFAELRPARRVEVAEVLLAWLESRDSLSTIADRHGVARQTVHDRLRLGKQLVGSAVGDPVAHAALVVALHAALPVWREEVGRRAERS
ncbi:MAG TPA: helix-turn-helix domain-containing protein [Nocardioides sp.]|nr:helix-turn-helix domain-containing protein [Nocardioides sp.]